MIRRLLFGRRCVLCREPLALDRSEKVRICPECAGKVRREYRCTHGKAVDHCTRTDSVLFYKDDIRRAMMYAKFYHRTGILRWFAEQTAVRLQANLDDWQPDYITFVPTSPLRKWVRGYDQSEIIARVCAERCGLECRKMLRRRFFSVRQSRMHSRGNRQRNAVRGFLPRSGADIGGKRIVLIDDILTSGSSASVCAGLLREMGACEVCLLTATRVP
ncbi:MAG: ComF family protein [Butyricicoccus sp.]|nr:ComF family protein [Butyricicoccus sp.]